MDIAYLKRIRMRLGLTQSQLAKQAGVSQSLITKIEAGNLDPKYSTVKRLEQAISLLESKNQPTVTAVLQHHIVSATIHEKIPHLIKRMQQANISQVPVMDGKHVAGLITERIILEAITADKELAKLHAEEIMIEAPPIIPSSTPIDLAAKLLEHVPIIIVREKQHILGIVTRSDILRINL
jgi:predicted transcriptional regulator